LIMKLKLFSKCCSRQPNCHLERKLGNVFPDE
jgi:hypothetical protein